VTQRLYSWKHGAESSLALFDTSDVRAQKKCIMSEQNANEMFIQQSFKVRAIINFCDCE